MGEAGSVVGDVHDIPIAGAGVPYVAEAKRTAAILIAGEFCCRSSEQVPKTMQVRTVLTDCSLRRLARIEANDSSATGSSIGLVHDLGLVDFADRLEQFDQVVVAGRPGELLKSCQLGA